jgi:hypothetical protein
LIITENVHDIINLISASLTPPFDLDRGIPELGVKKKMKTGRRIL